jgi:cell envelope opacity-associated protein A
MDFYFFRTPSSFIVKQIQKTQRKKVVDFNNAQAAAKKDVERTFRILQGTTLTLA